MVGDELASGAESDVLGVTMRVYPPRAVVDGGRHWSNAWRV
jgi:hypothetical protein